MTNLQQRWHFKRYKKWTLFKHRKFTNNWIHVRGVCCFSWSLCRLALLPTGQKLCIDKNLRNVISCTIFLSWFLRDLDAQKNWCCPVLTLTGQSAQSLRDPSTLEFLLKKISLLIWDYVFSLFYQTL